MLLQGKKIGFALTGEQLGDIGILKEIEKIMLEGAEIIIILLDPAEKAEGIKKKLEDILTHEHLEMLKKHGINEISIGTLESITCRPKNPFFDLLVALPNSERFLNLLAQATPGDCCNVPMVLVPALQDEPAPFLEHISSLMRKKGIFFVPFGPVKGEKANRQACLYSRLDLLTETCAAALKGEQLKPCTWENCFFPH